MLMSIRKPTASNNRSLENRASSYLGKGKVLNLNNPVNLMPAGLIPLY
jgi:hypothetical protein